MNEPSLETRNRYFWWMQIASRWADCDAYGHVNNAMYYNWIDTAVTTMLLDRGVLRGAATSIGLCVTSGCDFLAPIEFPQTVDAGVRLGRIGEKSLRYEVALFPTDGERPSAVGHFVHVFVDPLTRQPVALSEIERSAVADLLRSAT